MVDYIKEMEEDIKELNRLERRIGRCAVKIKNILLESRQKGALFHFRYSNLEPDKNWFMENFERFKDKINLSPYYTIGTYGNPEEKKKLWDKQMEIRNELTKHLHEERHELSKQVAIIKGKYTQFFDGIAYDSPEDGWSDMVEFLTVAVQFLKYYSDRNL